MKLKLNFLLLIIGFFVYQAEDTKAYALKSKLRVYNGPEGLLDSQDIEYAETYKRNNAINSKWRVLTKNRSSKNAWKGGKLSSFLNKESIYA